MNFHTPPPSHPTELVANVAAALLRGNAYHEAADSALRLLDAVTDAVKRREKLIREIQEKQQTLDTIPAHLPWNKGVQFITETSGNRMDRAEAKYLGFLDWWIRASKEIEICLSERRDVEKDEVPATTPAERNEVVNRHKKAGFDQSDLEMQRHHFWNWKQIREKNALSSKTRKKLPTKRADSASAPSAAATPPSNSAKARKRSAKTPSRR